MSSSEFNTPSPVRSNAGNSSPLTAKPMSQLNSYNKENLSGPGSTQAPRSKAPNSKVSHRLSLPMSLNNGESKSPFTNRNHAASGSNGSAPRRGRVTDGGATSSLVAGASKALDSWTPAKRPASVAELDDPQSAAKRPRKESGESLSSFEDRVFAGEGVSSTAPGLQGHPREFLPEDYPSIDAQYEAIWDEAARGSSKYGHLADRFEDEDAFGAWHEHLLDREGQQDQERRVEQSSRKSGDANTNNSGDLLQEENRVDAFDATTTPGPDDFEALLPIPLVLALRAFWGLADCAEHHLLVPRIPITQQAAPALPVVPATELPRAESLPLPDVPEMEDTRYSVPTVEENPVVAPEIPQATVTKSIGADEAGRKPKAARVRSTVHRQLAPPTPLLLPASREATPHPPQSPKAQVPQAYWAKSTGRRTRSARAQSSAPKQGTLISLSPPGVTLDADPEAAELPKARGAKSTGGKKSTRRTKESQGPSNGILGSSVAGPSNLTSAAQDLYSPALAQQIWDLSEAGKWRKALSLFVPEEEVMHIVGEAKVRAYLRDHPGAAKGLRPLKDGKQRQELFLCQSRTFWVPIKRKKGQAEGPRQFLLQHHAEDCVKGYTTPDNYNKHIYRNHLQKEYKSYAKEDGEEGRTTSVKGKGKSKACQATKKSKTPKTEEDEFSDEDEEENED